MCVNLSPWNNESLQPSIWNEWVRSWDKRGKILQQMKVWILKWGYYRMCETLLEFWNLFKVDEDSVPLTFVTYECQSFFVTYTMLKNLIKIKMKSPLKLDQLVYVVPIFSLQMLFQFFVLLWQSSHLLNANWILARPENLSPPMCIFAPPALTFLIIL